MSLKIFASVGFIAALSVGAVSLGAVPASAEGITLLIQAQQGKAQQVDEEAAAQGTMSEQGEMESLRLQMATDRQSKMMSTLSNIEKKNADTQSTLIQNMK